MSKAVRRISLIIAAVAAAAMLCGVFSLEKKELLELTYEGNPVYFIRYSLRGLNILTESHGESAFKVRILDITAKKTELIDTLKCNTGEYAAAVFQDRIKLYDPAGGLKAQYRTQDAGQEIKSCCISDIDGDSNEEVLLIEGDQKTFYGQRLAVLSWDDGLFKRYEREFRELNPWKVQTCDVDGDNRREIALGVYKEASFHPVMAKRPFLYNWDKEDIVPLWRGSRLSRPFDDYIFIDINIDGRDEIIAIERLSDGKKLINAYGWAGFGFESIAESMPYEDISELTAQHGGREGLMIRVKKGEKCTWVELEEVNEKLVEK
ncbi:MAG: hypothetical protein VB106_18540 [Clostridiaceae bacterium]|nr:hypothetical protein [Clostridiaceae bacterium]